MTPEFLCANLGDLRRHIEDFAVDVGFPHFGFVCEVRTPSDGGAPDLRFVTNHPPSWRDSLEAALSEGQPHNLVRHASLMLPALAWSAAGHLVGHTIVDDLARGHVRAMGGWGVRSGVLCPVAAPEIEWGALVLFSPDALEYEALDAVLARCALYASHFSFWYLQLAYRRTLGPRPQLTRREADCLHWASQGKTSGEIGIILGISDRTVEGYIASACEKLNARGRQAAITKASALQLIGGRNSLLAEFARQSDEAANGPPDLSEPDP